MALTDKLNAIGNAIRSKTSKEGKLSLEQMVTEINNLSIGGGLDYADELYNDVQSISYTSTNAGTALTINGIADIKNYPIIIVIIDNLNNETKKSIMINSTTVITNPLYPDNVGSLARYGTQLYYNPSGTFAAMSSTSYGLWAYSYTAAGQLTIRGRCYNTYYTSLTGTYRIKVLGIKI